MKWSSRDSLLILLFLSGAFAGVKSIGSTLFFRNRRESHVMANRSDILREQKRFVLELIYSTYSCVKIEDGWYLLCRPLVSFLSVKRELPIIGKL